MLPRCIVVRDRGLRIAYHRGRVSVDVLVERIARVTAAEGTIDSLAERLAPGLDAIAARWPNAPAISAEFADYVAAALARQPDPAAALARLRLDELFLAWWAGRGQTDGITAFEAAFAEDVSRLVARFHKLNADDLRQRLRIKLFVGTSQSPPRVREYAGVGSLQGWLKVTAARTFVDIARTDTRMRYEAELDEIDLIGLPAPGGTPRDLQARAQLGAAVKRAFATAVSGLAPRERTFLRHVSVDGLTLDQIASTYQVHRATVARTLKSARERLMEETRAGVVAELGIAPDDLGLALESLDSKLDLSLSRVFRTDRSP
jgi:RNA polymerase sigma-70 factor, ECF subfamily